MSGLSEHIHCDTMTADLITKMAIKGFIDRKQIQGRYSR
jgi:hypothetical protein